MVVFNLYSLGLAAVSAILAGLGSALLGDSLFATLWGLNVLVLGMWAWQREWEARIFWIIPFPAFGAYFGVMSAFDTFGVPGAVLAGVAGAVGFAVVTALGTYQPTPRTYFTPDSPVAETPASAPSAPVFTGTVYEAPPAYTGPSTVTSPVVSDTLPAPYFQPTPVALPSVQPSRSNLMPVG